MKAKPRCNDCGVEEGEQHQLGCISRVDEGIIRPDFEALRAERNARMVTILEEQCRKMGVPISEARTTFDPNACYCACPDGPCEHDFQGCRELADGFGAEQFCKRCGMGAMSHSLRTAE